MQFDFSEEWCKKAADLEEGYNVSAGVPMADTHYPVLDRAHLFDEYFKVSRPLAETAKDGDDRRYGLVTSNLPYLRAIWSKSCRGEVPEDPSDAIAFLEKQTLFGYPIKVDNSLPHFSISAPGTDVQGTCFTFDKYEEGQAGDAFKSAMQAIRIAIIDHEAPLDSEA